MPERSRKRPRDANELAKAIVDESTGDPDDLVAAEDRSKDAAAVELGRRGGLKGGRARADRLTSERRSEIARQAAQARWKKEQDG